MKKKLFQVKSSLELKMQKLNSNDLNFIKGGNGEKLFKVTDLDYFLAEAVISDEELDFIASGGSEVLAAGSSGSYSGSACISTTVACCRMPDTNCH